MGELSVGVDRSLADFKKNRWLVLHIMRDTIIGNFDHLGDTIRSGLIFTILTQDPVLVKILEYGNLQIFAFYEWYNYLKCWTFVGRY